MSDPHETLARVRAQAGAATEGPWEVSMDRIDHPGKSVFAVAYDVGCDEDAEFIAAARTDVPWLLEQVGLRDKALEAVLELHKDGGESQGYLDNGHYGVIDHCCTECGSHGEYGTPWPCPTVKAITDALDTNH